MTLILEYICLIMENLYLYKSREVVLSIISICVPKQSSKAISVTVLSILMNLCLVISLSVSSSYNRATKFWILKVFDFEIIASLIP